MDWLQNLDTATQPTDIWNNTLVDTTHWSPNMQENPFSFTPNNDLKLQEFLVEALPAKPSLKKRTPEDEDKRKRNTIASAKFRANKKQRDDMLQKKSVELAQKVEFLEQKVRQQEDEIKWLRSIVAKDK
jgi:hypothetical protein